MKKLILIAIYALLLNSSNIFSAVLPSEEERSIFGNRGILNKFIQANQDFENKNFKEAADLLVGLKGLLRFNPDAADLFRDKINKLSDDIKKIVDALPAPTPVVGGKLRALQQADRDIKALLAVQTGSTPFYTSYISAIQPLVNSGLKDQTTVSDNDIKSFQRILELARTLIKRQVNPRTGVSPLFDEEDEEGKKAFKENKAFVDELNKLSGAFKPQPSPTPSPAPAPVVQQTPAQKLQKLLADVQAINKPEAKKLLQYVVIAQSDLNREDNSFVENEITRISEALQRLKDNNPLFNNSIAQLDKLQGNKALLRNALDVIAAVQSGTAVLLRPYKTNLANLQKVITNELSNKIANVDAQKAKDVIDFVNLVKSVVIGGVRPDMQTNNKIENLRKNLNI